MTDTVPAKPVNEVPANPALLEWPRDEFGTLVNLRAALIEAARGCRGRKDRFDVLKNTIRMGLAHAMARLEADAAALNAELEHEAARIAERELYGRTFSNARPAGESEPVSA